MLKIDEFFGELDKVAPIKLSYKCIEQGDYDNSGILVRSHEEVEKVMFSLDLSLASIKEAKKRKCDTIVTHHPAIYAPIKNLSEDDMTTAPVLEATKLGFNVISMHLNLDIAKGGIDDSLAEAFGAKKWTALSTTDCGSYGKQFNLNKNFGQIVKDLKKELRSEKIIAYGNLRDEVKVLASFCGGGSSYLMTALKDGSLLADAVATSDIPHHNIKEVIESGRKLIIIPHYASEDYGFNKFYEKIKKNVGDVESFYFSDRRFK